MLKKLLWSTILALSLATGCKTKEPFLEPFVPVPIGAQDLSLEETIASERQEELEEIISEYNVPHVADIIYYDESNKSRFQATMDREYGVSKSGSEKI